MAKSTGKRQLILDIAERAVMTKGFGATSIDEIVAEAGITKGGFFYHFADKSALAMALLDRSVEQFDALTEVIQARAAELSDDPLQIVLIILKMLAEVIDQEENAGAGSMVSAIVYQERLFDRSVVDKMRATLLKWEERRVQYFEDIADEYELADGVDLEQVSAFFNTTFEGAIIHARATGRPENRAAQLLMYRSYIKLLFARRK